MTLPTQDADLVSIVIPTHNRALLLADAIESCLAQIYPAIEILIVDDGSTDDTASLVAGYAHPAIRYHRTENRGGGAARNAGLELARGKYVKFLDSDDALLPDALARQMARYRDQIDDPRDVVTGDFLRSDDTLGHGSLKRAPAAVRAAGAYDLAMVLITNPMTSCPLYPRAALQAVGGFDTGLPILQDYDIAVRIALAGYRFRYFPDVIYRWRVRSRTPRVSQSSAGRAAAQVALIAHHRQLLAQAHPDGVPDAVLNAFAKRTVKTALRLAHAGFMPEARKLVARARSLPGPLGVLYRFKIFLVLSGLATLAGHVYRRFG